ncbi:MAG: amino acid racemase [Clostridiales bacterium]|jgi:aspartate racemase|nr:amino acid racemase [Clostridiales bacterium]
MAKKLGVIGGLGPVATAYFYELVSRMTEAENDQEHLDINIISKPSIPDRTDYILGRSAKSPLPYLIEIGKVLEELGSDYIAMPCITAHYFYNELTDSLNIPIINIISETAKYLKRHNISYAGIMATEGTIQSLLFQHELEKEGINPIIPSEHSQSLVTSLIYDNVKAGKPVDMNRFAVIKDELIRKGSDIIILGCTELSMINRDENIGQGFVDALEILAMCSVIRCGARLKQEYT